VPDTETKIKINSDATGIDSAGVKWVISPYDEHAIEEALKTKQTQGSGEVIAFTLGPKSRVGDALRTSLAMGCDEAVLIDAPEYLDNYSTAKALTAAVQKEGSFDLILTGKAAIDDNASAVSQMIAEFLGAPHSTVVSKMETDASSTTVEREV
jgi:electron transfer flavoprotein beta subunit